MKPSERVREYLQSTLGEEVFTPDFIEGFQSLNLDEGSGTSQEEVQAAVDAAVSEANASWETRYRETFFGKPTEAPNESGTTESLPDNINDVKAPEPVSLDDIFSQEV